MFGLNMVIAAAQVESHAKESEAAILAGVRTALEFQAIDIHGQANKSMGYTVSRSRGVATAGGESLMMPSKQNKIRGRVRHDEFGLQKFSYRWQPGREELRVGPLRHGQTSQEGGPLSVHEGSSGGRAVYKDRYLFKKKKRGGGLRKRPDKELRQRFLGHTKGYALQRGGYSKPGFVIVSGKSERRVKKNRQRYERVGRTGGTTGRSYLAVATKRRARYLDGKINREVSRALKQGPRRPISPPR